MNLASETEILKKLKGEEISLSDSEILDKLDAAGVSMTDYTEKDRNLMIRAVREYWPISAATGDLAIPDLGQSWYYENIAAAAMTGNIKFVRLFTSNFRLSVEQADEVNKYILTDHTHRHRGYMTREIFKQFKC